MPQALSSLMGDCITSCRGFAWHDMHVLHHPASYSCNCCRMLQDNRHSYQRTNTHSRPLVLGQPYIEPDAADQDI